MRRLRLQKRNLLGVLVVVVGRLHNLDGSFKTVPYPGGDDKEIKTIVIVRPRLCLLQMIPTTRLTRGKIFVFQIFATGRSFCERLSLRVNNAHIGIYSNMSIRR